jgi:hypothetical protein
MKRTLEEMQAGEYKPPEPDVPAEDADMPEEIKRHRAGKSNV